MSSQLILIVEENETTRAFLADQLAADGYEILLAGSRRHALHLLATHRPQLVLADLNGHTLGLPDTLLDYPVDTSRAIAKLHYSNTFARTPDVKYQFVHAGGAIPYLASRFAIVDEMDVIPGAQERGAFADVLPRLYWDTASAFTDPVLHMLRSVTGLGNVVFGTDYPYPRDAISIGGLRQLENTAELDDGERRRLLGETGCA